MKTLFFSLLFLTFAVGGIQTTYAAAPLRVEGRNCTVADRGSEAWFGFFKGQRDVFSPLKGGSNTKDFTSWRCFEAEDECNSWTYWMQTDNPVGGNQAFCRKGG